MKKLSDFIVKKRNLILLVAVLLLIPSVIGYARTKVNYDLLSYLPQDAESMIGQKSLSDDFHLASTGMLVVENMPDKNVAELKNEIKAIDGVKDVLWRMTCWISVSQKRSSPKISAKCCTPTREH
ncbi:MAG: hypothetical protein ACLUQK_04020 [Clostridium sp.]